MEKKVHPEELIRATKPITVATGKAVAAGNSGKQEDVIVAANMGRKAVADLLKACKVRVRRLVTNGDFPSMIQRTRCFTSPWMLLFAGGSFGDGQPRDQG